MRDNSIDKTIGADDLCDMRDLSSYRHMIVFGESGSGKSYTVRKDMINVLEKFPKDKVILIDTCNEYGELVKAYGGVNCRICANEESVTLNGEDTGSDARLTVFNIGSLPFRLEKPAYLACLKWAYDSILENYANGKNTWLYLEGAPIHSDDGKLESYIRMMMDTLWGFRCRITFVIRSFEAMFETATGRCIVSNSDTALILRSTKTHTEMLLGYYKHSGLQAKVFAELPFGYGMLVQGGICLPFNADYEPAKLILPIKKIWFDMIVSGDKKEEYREIKPYYDSRFGKFFAAPDDKAMIVFRNGYSAKSPAAEAVCRLRKGKGRPEWGAEPGVDYYILDIHEVRNVTGGE